MGQFKVRDTYAEERFLSKQLQENKKKQLQNCFSVTVVFALIPQHTVDGEIHLQAHTACVSCDGWDLLAWVVRSQRRLRSV